jgi:ATP-binding cassette subfamily F protein 3
VIVVSHDRYFLDRVVQRLIVLERGRYKDYPGNYSYYSAKLQAEAMREAEAKAAARAARKPSRKPPAKRQTTERKKADPYAAMPLERIEELIEQRQARVAKIEELFANPDIYQDHERAARLRVEYDAVRAEVEEITAVWVERVEQMG